MFHKELWPRNPCDGDEARTPASFEIVDELFVVCQVIVGPLQQVTQHAEKLAVSRAVTALTPALVAHRAYKAGWSLGDAVAEVRRQRGIKLDAQIVDALDGAEGDPSFRALLARRESA